MPSVAALASVTAGAMTNAWRTHAAKRWKDGGNLSIPTTMEQVRQRDLKERHIADNLRSSFKPGPGQYEWQMFEQTGCVVDGIWTRSWCVYSCDDHDRAYEKGLWFTSEAVALACLEWKRQRAKPGVGTRLAVRIWRMLPWR